MNRIRLKLTIMLPLHHEVYCSWQQQRNKKAFFLLLFTLRPQLICGVPTTIHTPLLFVTSVDKSPSIAADPSLLTEQLHTMPLWKRGKKRRKRGDAQMKETMIIALVTIETSLLDPPISSWQLQSLPIAYLWTRQGDRHAWLSCAAPTGSHRSRVHLYQ